MKNSRSLSLVALLVFILAWLAGAVMIKHQSPHRTGLQTSEGADIRLDRTEALPTSTLTSNTAPQQETAPSENPKQLKSAKDRELTNHGTQKSTTQANQGGPAGKEPLKDPIARVALAFVGADADAEAYWYEAINDPKLPANERQDLIEDLNEDGLSDPKHPTTNDLPLIFSRLQIIEEAAPDAMDKVNADAFQEAYKDLVHLANVAMGGGEPVR